MSVFDGVLIVLFLVSFVLAAASLGMTGHARTCQLCHRPRDPKSETKGTWEYGVLACDDCGKKLHARYKDEPVPRDPPPWTRP